MSVTTILDLERITGNYLRAHADIVALDARVAGQLPSNNQSYYEALTTCIDRIESNLPKR